MTHSEARKRAQEAGNASLSAEQPETVSVSICDASGPQNGNPVVARSTLPAVHFALDGENEPTLWLRRPHASGDKALIRRCDVGETAWAVIVTAVEEAQALDEARAEVERFHDEADAAYRARDAATARADALAAKVERVIAAADVVIEDGGGGVSAEVVLCGNGCGHDHNSPNGPSGCCTRNPDHGPYLYFCGPCHDEWAAANPDEVAQIRRLAARLNRPSKEGD